MEKYFEKFRNNIIGNDLSFKTPVGKVKMHYADWIASGRLYQPIEDRIINTFGPYVGNTHTETSETGTLMTKAYHYAHKRIKEHVNANEKDLIITAGFGMTSVINKLQRILGLKQCGKIMKSDCIQEKDKPVVFITHMEHHSNHTNWYETNVDVVPINPDKDLLVDLNDLKAKLEKYKDRKFKIGSFTACSNVTGIITPFHTMAKLMHEHGGYCFIDYAASAPYVDINMHPEDPKESLDAIFFSPHKFLGGPGTSGVMVFNSDLYPNYSPDNPGGGTVDWTNPWGEYKYVDDIEAREDGGTPGFLQAIKTSLCIDLKNKMSVEQIMKREEELTRLSFKELDKIPGIHILANNVRDRLPIISFYIENIHYNLVVRLLNDYFGIQARGGCACAGTYGHYLLDVTHEHSKEITERINSGDLSVKPGWIRLSFHPTMTNDEIRYIIDAVKQITIKYSGWSKDYIYSNKSNEFRHRLSPKDEVEKVVDWFSLD
ncbi:aminotransferase class V-fold PLP-dependent enzyme [candidate division KSB1 bacterium]